MFILLYSYMVRNPELLTLHAVDDVVQSTSQQRQRLMPPRFVLSSCIMASRALQDSIQPRFM
jgi:hypothetical protein